MPKRLQRRKWSTLKHVNGVAVYMEESGEDGTGGAIMASLVVRAPPRDVFTVRVGVMLGESVTGTLSGERDLSTGEVHFNFCMHGTHTTCLAEHNACAIRHASPSSLLLLRGAAT